MKSTLPRSFNQTGGHRKDNYKKKAGERLRLSSGILKGCSRREILTSMDSVPANLQEFLSPAPINGFVDGDYTAVFFDYPLNGLFVPSPKAFQIVVDELEEQTPSAVSIEGGVLFLRLQETVEPGRQAVIQYFPPTKNPLQDENEFKVEAFKLFVHNLGEYTEEYAAAGDEDFEWFNKGRIQINVTANSCLNISWEAAGRSMAFYQLIVFVDEELSGIHETFEECVVLEELKPGAAYEFLVLAVDAAERIVSGPYVQWRQPL